MSRTTPQRRSQTAPVLTPFRRWRRRVAMTIVILACVLLAAGYLMTRSWFIIMWMQPQLEARLGGPVSIGEAAYRGGGTLIFSDVRLHSPDLAGEVGQIARLERLKVLIDPGALWKGEVKLNDIEIFGLHIRMSEDVNRPGEMNFMTLHPKWIEGPHLPPTVRILKTVVEVGAHDGTSYQANGLRIFNGVLHPLDLSEGLFGFELNEIDENMAPLDTGGLRIRGNWNATTFELAGLAEGLQLDESTYRMCPSLVSLWWEQMQLAGRVYGVSFHYLPAEKFQVEFSVENVELTLPIETEGLWASFVDGKVQSSFDRPRMYVQRGRIRIGEDLVELEDLEGTLGSASETRETAVVPYRLNVQVHSLPRLDWEQRGEWMTGILETAPFEMSFEIDDFNCAPDDAGHSKPVDLPAPIARVLEQFNMTRWSLSTEFAVRRGGPGVVDDPANDPNDIRVQGTVQLEQAFGAYDRFPYPLENVSARIAFDHQQVVIEDMRADGAGRVPLHMTGVIAPIGRNPSVKLHLEADDLPVDATLRAALNERQQAVFDAFFHRDNYDALIDGGLLDADDFPLGGTVDMRLDITRREGAEQPVLLTGELDIHSLGVVHSAFPYPVRVHGGHLSVSEDRIDLIGDDGLPISTPGGGEGYVRGHVVMLRGEDGLQTEPDLTLTVRNDGFNELLFAAIPLTEGERETHSPETVWPGGEISRTGRLLKGLGLTGTLEYQGAFFLDDEGRFDYDIEVLHTGTMTPREDVAQLIGASGLIWPEGFTLDDVTCNLRIARDRIDLQQFEGHDGVDIVTAVGRLELATPASDSVLAVHFDHLDFGTYLLNMAPTESIDTVREIWERYQPEGYFSLDLRYSGRIGETDQFELEAMPEDVGLWMDGQRVRLTREHGLIRIVDRRVEFEDLALALRTGDRADGTVHLNGAYAPEAPSGELQARGEWRDGRLESPLVTETLRIIGAQQQIEYYRMLTPSGSFDAQFDYESPQADGDPRFNMIISPRDITAQLDERRLAAQFDPGARVTFEPGLIRIEDTVGRVTDGVFHVDGIIRLDEGVDITANLEYDGPLRSPDIEAILPERIRNWADQVEFSDTEVSSLHDGHLRIRNVELESGETGWTVDFAGQLKTANAAIVLGTSLTDIAGSYDVNFRHHPDLLPDVEIAARVDEMRILDREIRSMTAFAYLDREQNQMRVPLIKGESNRGKISGSATFGIGGKRNYDIELDLVGVGLEGLVNPEPAGDEADGAGDVGPNSSFLNSEVFGTVRMTGERGDPESRIGRGAIRTIGSKVAEIPLALRIVQILQSMLPFGSDLDYFDTSFYIDGDYVVFEDMLLENSMGDVAPIQIFGDGRMHLDSQELDLTFRLRTGPAILRDVLGGIGDQIVSITMTGPLNDPVAQLVLLPGLGDSRSSSTDTTRIVIADDE